MRWNVTSSVEFKALNALNASIVLVQVLSSRRLSWRDGTGAAFRDTSGNKSASCLPSTARLQALLCRSEWKTEHISVEICMNELAGYCALLGLSIRHRDLWGIGRFSASFFYSFSQFANAASLRLRNGRIPTVGEGKLHFYYWCR